MEESGEREASMLVRLGISAMIRHTEYKPADQHSPSVSQAGFWIYGPVLILQVSLAEALDLAVVDGRTRMLAGSRAVGAAALLLTPKERVPYSPTVCKLDIPHFCYW
jgi:hypothetical protein